MTDGLCVRETAGVFCTRLRSDLESFKLVSAFRYSKQAICYSDAFAVSGAAYVMHSRVVTICIVLVPTERCENADPSISEVSEAHARLHRMMYILHDWHAFTLLRSSARSCNAFRLG